MTTTPEETQELPLAPVAEELERPESGPPAELIAEIRTSPLDGTPMVRVLEHRDFPDGVHKFYSHPQPAVLDVDALAEFISNIEATYPQIRVSEFSTYICNWIEEQQNEQ